MDNTIPVKFLKKFRNPITNRMAIVGSEMNVPNGIFWMRRIEQKDCEKLKRKIKVTPAPAPAESKAGQSSKKGSK